MKTSTRYLNKRAVAAVFAAGVLALAAGTAHARKGPQASVASSTTCALSSDDTMLIVTTSLTDKSSGNEEANVTGGTIQPDYKPTGVRGNASTPFPESYTIGDTGGDLGLVGAGKEIVGEFDLCKRDFYSNPIGVRDEVNEARELNATSTVNYDSDNGPAKSVTNRCSADPETGLGGGIKVADVFELIYAACNP